MARVPTFQHSSISDRKSVPTRINDSTAVGDALMKLGNVMSQVHADRQQRLDRLQGMQAVNENTSFFRDRFFEIDQIKPDQSIGIYEAENEFVLERREEYAESLEGLSTRARELSMLAFDRVAGGYLNQISSSMRQKLVQYEEDVLSSTTARIGNAMADAIPGEWDAIVAGVEELKASWEGFPEDKIQGQVDSVVAQTYMQWAREYPEATLASWDERKTDVRAILSPKGYVAADTAVRQAVNDKLREANLRRQAEKDLKEQLHEDANQKILEDLTSGKLENIVDEIRFNPNMPVTGTGGKTWWLENIENMANIDWPEDSEIALDLRIDSYNESYTQEFKDRVFQAAERRDININTMKEILNNARSISEDPDNPVNIAMKREVKLIRDFILGTGFLARPTPEDHLRANRAIAELTRRVMDTKEPDKKIQLLTAGNSSYLTQSIAYAFKASDMTRMKESTARIRDTNRQLPADEQIPVRQGNESIEDFEKRKNQ